MNHEYNTAYDYDIIDQDCDRRQLDDYRDYDNYKDEYMDQDDYEDDYEHEYENEYEYDYEPEPLPSLSALSLYDIMGEDHYMHLTKNQNGTYNIEVSDENAKPLVSDEHIHPYAIESLASFCKHFLNLYSRYSNLHIHTQGE